MFLDLLSNASLQGDEYVPHDFDRDCVYVNIRLICNLHVCASQAPISALHQTADVIVQNNFYPSRTGDGMLCIVQGVL